MVYLLGKMFCRNNCTCLKRFVDNNISIVQRNNVNVVAITGYYFTAGVKTRYLWLLPWAGCSLCWGPVRQQMLCAGQRRGDNREGQQIVVPVQLRQRVNKARQSKLCLPGVVIKWNLWSIRPQVHTSPRVPEGQGLFAGRYVKTHEQLAPGVDMKNIRHIGQTSGLTELALTWTKKQEVEHYSQAECVSIEEKCSLNELNTGRCSLDNPS